jgi:quercetin dioxygenase-like cupin family protein
MTPSAELPHVLGDIGALAMSPSGTPGAMWKLAEPGRQLDANVVHLPPGQHVGTHAEPDLDVLVLVVAGDGDLAAAGKTTHLMSGTLLWLPRGSVRSLSAGQDGLSYLTVHRRRPGMRILPAPPWPASLEGLRQVECAATRREIPSGHAEAGESAEQAAAGSR